ncbi:MAG: valine--tRNA ligase [Parcubacteria bacterium C7867-007]|nr:MAG: valine--tRNA ligase [Parcubacteria bacterium C7867-007]
MDEKFKKPYEPAETEARLYKAWEESGYFNPDNLPNATKGPFTIMMPPPNATGVLHMGHMLGCTIQDIMIRFRRLQGYEALFLPGTDHAAIATQARVEKDISKNEGKSRHDLGREELVRRIDEFVEGSRDTIRKQIRATGASCDWSREAFTFDEARNRAVNQMFKDMYDAGLIYKGLRIVNWDPKGQTTISDDEIVHEERPGKLYTFKYAKDFPITIATSRPETKVGDTAVAVHPNDPRYKEFIGNEYDLEFCGSPLHIKIVADESVEPEFGTGALGVTPAHAHIDWEIGERNNLPHPQVIDERAKIMVEGPLHGLKVAEAREKVVEWLKEQNLLESEVSITQNISTAERTGGVIEPLPKLQWFIDVNKPIKERGNKSLKELMLEPVRSGAINILPDHYDKTYYHWIENLRDWCISRQIWYGHRVPVWTRGEESVVGDAPAGDWKAEGWVQDEDTLDTWFSSGSWTFSTLGWPNEAPDLARFHPTDVLETAYEILFFWVARMILMSQFVLGEIPFRTVYLHGLVRDAQGRKFSKSLGNGIDPIEVINKFGADAARISLVIGNTPGTDMKLSEDRIKGYKHFANKLWNITRFILENTEDVDLEAPRTEADFTLEASFANLAADVTKDMEAYRLYLAADKLYQYAWSELASTIIEESKPILSGDDAAAAASRKAVLRALLKDLLILLHPFMPFVTEEIWQSLPETEGMLIVAQWPSA